MKYKVVIARTVRHSVLIEAKDEQEIIKAVDIAKQKGLVYDKNCYIEHIERVDSMYAISVDDSEGNPGFTHGPTPDLKKLLEVIPKFPLSKIIDLPDKVIYDWNSEENKWVLKSEIKT